MLQVMLECHIIISSCNLMSGMTGSRLNAADLMQTDIATHFFPRCVVHHR